MVTTILSHHARPESQGAAMVYLDALSSVPDVGGVRDGIAIWWVKRGVDTIKRSVGLRFAWASRQPDDVLWCRYYDRDGNSGGAASYTLTMSSTFNGEQFTKGAGSNANSGIDDANAVQTLAQAISNTRSAWGAGQTRAINLRAGETFSTTGVGTTNCWTMDLEGHIVLRRYGAGANPIITLPSSGNGSILFGGQIGINAITVVDVQVQSDYTLGGAVNHSAVMVCSGLHASAVRASIVFLGVQVTGVGTGWVLSTGESVADRGKMDFIALCDGGLDVYTGGAGSPSTGGHAFIGADYGRRLLQQDWTWGRTDGANGFVRGVGWHQMVVDNVLIDRQSVGAEGNTFRVNGGTGGSSDDHAHEITFHNVRWRRCGEGLELEPVAADTIGFRNIELVNCSGDFAGTSFSSSLVKCVVSTSNQPDLDGLRVINCWSRQNERVPMVQLNAGSGPMNNVLLAHNTVVGALDGEFSSAYSLLVTQSGSGFADGGLTLRNNYAFSLGTGAGGETPVALFAVAAAAKINASSDRNVLRKAAGFAWWCVTEAGNRSLVSWRGDSAADDNSVQDTGPGNLVDTGTGTFNARPASGIGPQINVGGLGVVVVDGDGNLFGAQPDAGAFEFGGAPPAEPSGGADPIFAFLSQLDHGHRALTAAGLSGVLLE